LKADVIKYLRWEGLESRIYLIHTSHSTPNVGAVHTIAHRHLACSLYWIPSMEYLAKSLNKAGIEPRLIIKLILYLKLRGSSYYYRDFASVLLFLTRDYKTLTLYPTSYCTELIV